MTRTRIIVTLTTAGLAGLLGLTACAQPGTVASAQAPAAADATPSAAAAHNGKPGPARRLLRKNTLHGEVTLQTKKGVTAVAAQQGTVTAVDARTVTVKSTDGFTATWSFGEKLRVVKDHQTVDRRSVTVGTHIGIAGAKVQTGPVARLIRIQK